MVRQDHVRGPPHRQVLLALVPITEAVLCHHVRCGGDIDKRRQVDARCAPRSTSPPHEPHFRQSASDTSTCAGKQLYVARFGLLQSNRYTKGLPFIRSALNEGLDVSQRPHGRSRSVAHARTAIRLFRRPNSYAHEGAEHDGRVAAAGHRRAQTGQYCGAGRGRRRSSSAGAAARPVGRQEAASNRLKGDSPDHQGIRTSL